MTNKHEKKKKFHCKGMMQTVVRFHPKFKTDIRQDFASGFLPYTKCASW